MDAMRDAAKAEGERVMGTLPARVAALDALVAELFPIASPSAAHAKFLAGAPGGAANAEVGAALSRVLDEMAAASGELGTVARWISLAVPKVEDGGNWGVEVQHHAHKLIKDVIKKLREEGAEAPKYYAERAGALEKFTGSKDRVTDTTTSKTASTGGKDGDSTVESTASSTKELAKEPMAPLADAVASVAAMDTKWYFTAKAWLEDMRDELAVVADTLEKNVEKITAPKGSQGGGGGGAMSYY